MDAARDNPAAFGEAYFSRAYGADCALANPPAKLRFHLNHLMRLAPGGRLLDVGCGYGYFLAEARARYRVEGCDISAHALERARERLPGVPLHRAPAGELSLPGSFDVITCFDSLEHLPDLPNALANLVRHLAPGGVLALTVPVYDGLPGLLVRLLDRDPTHLVREGGDFWRRALASQGLAPALDIGEWRYFLARRRYLFFASPHLRGFSPALFLAGRK